MKIKIMLLCSVFGFAVCFNGLGERTITYNPNYGPEIAAENAAALAAAREANNRQAEQQYEIDLAQQQQAMDAARKQLWDDSVSKIKDEAQQALDKLSEQYTPNLNELNSQQRALQLVATNLNEQKIQSETRNNLLRAKQMFQPKDPWRMLDGKVCCAKDQGWFQFSGNVLEVKANGILLDGEIGHPFENGIPVPKYFVENFPNATYPFADGENINKNMDFVAHLGEKSVYQYTNTTISYGVETVRRLDYGKIVNSPPPDLIKKWEIPIIVAGGADDDIIAEIKTNQAQLSAVTQKLSQFQSDYDQKTKQILDDRDSKIRDLPKTLAKQAKEQQDKAKQQQAAKILAFNQALADKGDAYGLLRMGELYRDGEGVPKDLTKSRDYFSKAIAAGSPSAPDELSKLNQASTNSPATQ